MIRVVVAEDSQTARTLLVAILELDPVIRVVGQAADGVEAVALVRRLRPDVVLMDIRMPRMDGYDATRQIMAEAPTPIVLVSANVDVAEAGASVRALHLGALWVMRKPSGPASPHFDEEARQLVSMVKAMSDVKVVTHWQRPAHKPAGASPVPAPRRSSLEPPRGPTRPVVALAASTGGPSALGEVLSGLAGSYRGAVLVVQHISRGFVGSLANSLSETSGFPVAVARHGDQLKAGQAYVAPDDLHLGLGPGGTIQLSDEAPRAGFKPSASLLFESVARVLGRASLAVILTGMGRDGIDGLRAVRAAGGVVLAQDRATSVVYGMPGAAYVEGLTNEVLPVSHIANRILEVVGHEREE